MILFFIEIFHMLNFFQSVLFGKLLQFIKKYDNVSSVNDNVWTLLQTVLPKYQQGQRSNSNQRMVSYNKLFGHYLLIMHNKSCTLMFRSILVTTGLSKML